MRRIDGPRPKPSVDADETLFFIHIPKCAGTSFRAVLKRWFNEDLLVFNSDDPQAFKDIVAQMGRPPKAVTGHMPFGLHEGTGCRPCYMSLVRDPVDRFVSLYKHARQTPDHFFHPAAAALSLGGFYEHTLSDPRSRQRTVAIQCFFLARVRSFEGARAVVADNYRLIAPLEDFDRFVSAAAALLGKPEIPAPVRNRRPSDDAVATAAASLAPRIRQDHFEDQQLYEHICRAARSGG